MRFICALLIELSLLLLVACAEAKDAQMSKNFAIAIGPQTFSVSSPTAPEGEFAKYQPSVILDEELFRRGDALTLLSVHWTFRHGLLHKVAGVLELQAFVRDARSDVSSEFGLQQGIQDYFRRELSKIHYAGGTFPIVYETINRRSWARYRVPVLGITEYSVGLSGTKFLTVQFALIDNTGDPNPEWQREADELMRRIISTLKLE